jgi:hypothetical protein
MKTTIQLAVVSFVCLFSVMAQGTLSDAAQRIVSEIGTQQSITATLTCNLDLMVGGSGGNIGTPNQMLCLAKSMNIAGATPAAGVTSQVTVGGQTFTVHYIVTSPGATIDGVTYNYEMKIWTCGSGCTTASAFFPAIYVAFNASSDGVTNTGVLINNFGADSGTLKGSAFIKWDVGSATTTKYFRLNMVDCSSAPTTAIYAYYTRVGTVATMNELVSQAAATVTRTAVAWDTSANTGNWQQDSVVSAGGDSPAWSGGFTRTATATDYTYSAASTSSSYTIGAYPTEMSGTTLSGASNQGITCSGITASNGVTSVTSGANVLTTTTTAMGGMTLHPDSI